MRRIPVPRHSYLKARSLSGFRFYREFPGNQTHPFHDDHWSYSAFFHLLHVVATGEGKTFAVIFHSQIPLVRSTSETHHGVTSTAVLAHIHYSLLHDAQNFTADTLRHIDLFKIRHEPGTDSCFPLKTFDVIFQYSEEPLRVDIDRLHLLHEFAQFEDFFPQQTLDAAQFFGDG